GWRVTRWDPHAEHARERIEISGRAGAGELESPWDDLQSLGPDDSCRQLSFPPWRALGRSSFVAVERSTVRGPPTPLVTSMPTRPGAARACPKSGTPVAVTRSIPRPVRPRLRPSARNDDPLECSRRTDDRGKTLGAWSWARVASRMRWRDRVLRG